MLARSDKKTVIDYETAYALLNDTILSRKLTSNELFNLLTTHKQLISIAVDQDLLSCLDNEDLTQFCREEGNIDLVLANRTLSYKLSEANCKKLIETRSFSEKLLHYDVLINNFRDRPSIITNLLLLILEYHSELITVVFALPELVKFISDDESLARCASFCNRLPTAEIPLIISDFLVKQQGLDTPNPYSENPELDKADIIKFHQECERRSNLREEMRQREIATRNDEYNPYRIFIKSSDSKLISNSLQMLLASTTQDINEDDKTVTIICHDADDNEKLVKKMQELGIVVKEQFIIGFVINLYDYKKIESNMETNPPSKSY